MKQARRESVDPSRWLLLAALAAGLAGMVAAANPQPFDAAERTATIAATAAEDAPYLVRLESRVFLPRARADLRAGDKIFVQFKRTLTIEEQTALEQSGVVFHESLEPFAYLVSISRDAAAILQGHALFLGAEPIQPTDKVTVSIFRNDVPEHARRPDGIAVFFRFYENVTLAEALTALDAADITVSDRSGFLFGNRLAVVATRDRILAACASPAVRAAFEIPRTPVVNNVVAAGISNVPPVNAAPYALNGSGVAVGIWDGGQVRSTHQDLAGRITIKESAHPINDHSTHVAGTVLGTGLTDATSKGMAPSATAFSYDFDGDIPTEQATSSKLPPTGDGIALSNNSWGYSAGWVLECPSNTCSFHNDPNCYYVDIGEAFFGTYDAESSTYDNLVRTRRLTVVKSAGNEGTHCGPADCAAPRDTDCNGVLGSDGFRYDDMDNVSSAKNVLTVGALKDDGTTKTDFSSCGPTDDGRIKPTVVANGETLNSTGGGSDTEHLVMSGTSMSGPVVSGVVTLIDEEWKKLHLSRSSTINKATPELVRALLINTATDLGRPGPDYAYGYGLARAKEAIDQLQAPNAAGTVLSPPNQVRTAFVSEGETLSFRVSTPAGPTGTIKTTVVWDDLGGTSASVVRYCNFINFKVPCTSNADCTPYNAAAVGDAAPCGAVPCNLKNDLETWLWNAPANAIIGEPWVPPGVGAITSNASQYFNRVDNVESIQSSDPNGGNLLFTVFGATVTGGQQRFTLAANKPVVFFPGNDNFASARVLPALLPADATATECASGQIPCPATLYPHNTWDAVNFDATMELGEPSGIPAGHSVWYTWVAPSNGQATFDTAGADFDTILDVWTGNSVGALTFVASSDDFYGKQSKVGFTAVAGTTYRIRVWGHFPSGAAQDDSMGVFPLNYYLIVCGNGVTEPGETCDDGNTTDGDCCSSMCTLAHAGVTCSLAGNQCAFGTCSGATCTGITPITCDDGNVCTDDACNPATGCVFTNNNASCSDGNSCTTNDFCVSGICAGGPPPAVPASTPSVTFGSKTQLGWPALAGATGYDAVKGDLSTLRASGGDFTTATTTCLADDQAPTQLDDAGTPAPGSGFFYLVRGTSCSGSGTYDTGSPRQIGSRDAEVDAAPIACATFCARGKCTAGPPLDAGCDGCTAALCGVDPYCCNTGWDAQCITEVRTLCGSLTCAESAGACGHPVCSAGPLLVPGCDDPPVDPSCVSTICTADPFCCTNTWDAICVSEVGMCGWNCN